MRRALQWVGAFGSVHGLHEWVDMVATLQGVARWIHHPSVYLRLRSRARSRRSSGRRQAGRWPRGWFRPVGAARHLVLSGRLLRRFDRYRADERVDEGFWDAIEGYLSHHSEATFTHGVCPSRRDALVDESTCEPSQDLG